MKCLILAAGENPRLTTKKDQAIPLMKLMGVTLMEHALKTAMSAGIDDFYVVTGYQGEQVRRFLDEFAKKNDVQITHVVNDEWQKGSGHSLLEAKEHFSKDPFLVMMVDHQYESSAIRELAKQPIRKDDVVIAVDEQTMEKQVDWTSVTRVSISKNHVKHIARGLHEFNGLDMGLYLCSPNIFKVLKEKSKQQDSVKVMEAISTLAEQGSVRAYDMSHKFWMDVDSFNALERAEERAIEYIRYQPKDNFITKHLFRPFSTQLTKIIVNTKITLKTLSICSLILSIFAALLFSCKPYMGLLIGGFLAYFVAMLHLSHGEIDKLNYKATPALQWFDDVLAKYAEIFLLVGLTAHGFYDFPHMHPLFIGAMAVVGNLMMYYSSDRYQYLFKTVPPTKYELGINRDVRFFMIALGAILNLSLIVLLIIAIIMNAIVIQRLVSWNKAATQLAESKE